MQLKPKTILISVLKTDTVSPNPARLYDEIQSVLTIRKRATMALIDTITTDFCEFKSPHNYHRYLDMIDARNTVVVDWVPGCHMAYHTSALGQSQQ